MEQFMTAKGTKDQEEQHVKFLEQILKSLGTILELSWNNLRPQKNKKD
jgi:hypothetical protein